MKLQFNKKIYLKSAVQKAMKDYSHLANFDLSQSKDYFLVEIINMPPELKDVFEDEFSNYALSLMKK
ncbi:MAG: HxsD-like protein [bacterium]|nr:HxsD-like protein [bacterium]